MYATEKYVKMEAKELRETINELANDLGGDIRYLHSLVTELQANIITLHQELESIKDAARG
jgi:uncharacterized coiled-coil DUF342 family protein